MSFLLVREVSIVFIFLFYTYSYFALDEEFIIFIIVCLWLLFIIIAYLKTISSIFSDNMEALSNEFFFFHDKKNMLLTIFRDQYFDFILLNKFMYNFFFFFQNSINSSINYKVLSFYENSNLYLSESVNFFKQYYKTFLLFVYISVFSFFHNIIFFIFYELNKLINLFEKNYYNIRSKFENEDIKKFFVNKKSYNTTSLTHLLPFFVKGHKNLRQFSSFLLYRHLIKNSSILTIENIYLFDTIHILKSPSILKIIQKLNIKQYFEHLFLYFILKEFSFIDLH